MSSDAPQEKDTLLLDDFIGASNKKRERNHISGKEQQDLWKEVSKQNEELEMEDYNTAIGFVKAMHRIHDKRNKEGYQLAVLVNTFKDERIFENLGYDSFSKFAKDQAKCPFPRSSAYRYAKVGNFMEELDVGSDDFDEVFYEELGVKKITMKDAEGNIDEEATKNANKVTTRVNFMDMDSIAGLYSKDKITTAMAKELMANAMVMNHEDFKLALREAQGEESPETPAEKLQPEGLLGDSMVIPRSELSQENASGTARNLRNLARRIEEGDLDDLDKLEVDDAQDIASKSVKFRKVNGRVYITT